MAPKPLQQGDPAQIGRYQLTARLGSGGMGVVYLAQAGDGRQVAVKVLRPEYADDGEFRARFQREVAAMRRVRNRYTVQVLDADTDSAMPFLVTEFADGPSLDEHVRAQGPLHPQATIRFAGALAEALAAIHAAGVTHRDLKPSNVLLTGRGPMVIDFGIAQVADSVSITRTGMAIGSPGYMAPEQVTGHAGREADIFTWALIVAFAASGQPPFGTGPTVAILQRILNDRPDISGVPPQLTRLVQAALAKDPKRRPAAVDLLRELSPGGATAAMPPPASDPQLGVAPTAIAGQTAVAGGATRNVWDNGSGGTARTRVPGGEPGPRRRWFAPAVAAGAAVAVIIGVGVALLANGGSQPGSSTPGDAKSPATSATGPALSRANTNTGAASGPGAGLATQGPAGQQQVPPGQAKKHRDGGGSGGGGNAGGDGNGNGNGGGSTPASTPSASPAATPSASPSPVTSPSPSVSPSPAASTTSGEGAASSGTGRGAG
ncbi:MAG TPA: serine/threonine-protein kinase [Trebonia sp.]|nr:serine/threonine-protein kinase [Trebonia sp.]